MQICQNMSDKKVQYKAELKKTQKMLEVEKEKHLETQKRLDIVDGLKGLEKLNDFELEELEKLYYKGLDLVKNARCQNKYRQEIESLKALLSKNTEPGQENLQSGKPGPFMPEKQNVLYPSN